MLPGSAAAWGNPVWDRDFADSRRVLYVKSTISNGIVMHKKVITKAISTDFQQLKP
jgi:hypothetical protein